MRTNLVGRAEVSAITHTPASGPDGPLTTPAMSSLSIGIAGPWPPDWVGTDASTPRARTPAQRRAIVLIAPPRKKAEEYGGHCRAAGVTVQVPARPGGKHGTDRGSNHNGDATARRAGFEERARGDEGVERQASDATVKHDGARPTQRGRIGGTQTLLIRIHRANARLR